MRQIAAVLLLCVFGALLPSATAMAVAAPQQLVPICCRAHGGHACVMGTPVSNEGSALRQPPCPFHQSLRAITIVSISASLNSQISFGLVVTGVSQERIADAIAARFLRLCAPRGPPSSFSV